MVCTSLETAHAAVVQLVHDFAASEAHYLAPGYSEAQARQDFIDKLWMALGWDVAHQHQKNPYAQEVKVEDPQKIQGANRRADYAFHTAPNFRDARFFCEAKKPAVQLKTDADAAFQTIRYGWSAGTPLAVLTDFEQLHVLDCRAKADIETALARSHLYFHYKDWLDPEKFAKLYYLFSREAFRDGGFDAYVSKLPRPKKVGKQLGLLRTGSQPVDAAFLLDLEGYRAELAKLLKAADHSLDGDALTELVQRILDRLVFLRFLEDKLIETEIQVHHFARAAGGHSWAKFLAASRKLDARYNGIVFKVHPILDTPGRLAVDDAGFADLCEELSHTKSSYSFSTIPIHILGSIYERFLGSVIVTTDQRARVEEKPEVRKAGGVYYTPECIVRYICEQTVGRLIEGKTPAQIARMRFADIACGSGSFLLGVYDLLIRHHGLWYNAHKEEAVKENLAPPDKGKKRKKEFIPAVSERDGGLRLTLEKKREILLNNVFGVDLDPQAVEVAQLSLYLKLLEDETTASAHQHYLDFHEALLPSLHKNICCGNSLIGLDVLFGEFAFTGREEVKLRPMDFASAFPEIFPPWLTDGSSRVAETSDGGFIDFGAGEPIRDLVHYDQKAGTKRRKQRARPPQPALEIGGFDAIVGNPPYVLVQILEQAAVFQYLSNHYQAARYKIDTYHVFIERALSLLREGGMLGYITPNTFLRNKHARELRGVILRRSEVNMLRLFFYQVFEGASVDTAILIATKRVVPSPANAVAMVVARSPQHAEPIRWQQQAKWLKHPTLDFSLPGLAGADELVAKIKARSEPLGSFATAYFGIQTFDRTRFVTTVARPGFKPVIDGGHVDRFRLKTGTEFVDYRPEAIKSGGKQTVYEQDRIGVRQIGKIPIGTLIPGGLYTLNTIYNIYPTRPVGYTLPFVLGVILSRAHGWFWQQCFFDQKDTFPKIKKEALLSIPIPKLDFTKPGDKKQHDRMVQLVEMMLATQKQLAAAANETDRTHFETKAAGLDRQIDGLTCDLYDLTREERELVAGS